jgi:hypothetical protein
VPKPISHAIREFATGVGFMAETGNTSDIASLMERLTEALVSQSEAHARVTVRPRLPSWAVSVLVGLAVAFGTAFTGGLVAYGALQNRVANLELRTQSIDGVSSMATKLDLLKSEVERMEERFNALIDRQAEKRDK